MLAPPVTEEVLVGSLTHLDDRHATVFYELGEESTEGCIHCRLWAHLGATPVGARSRALQAVDATLVVICVELVRHPAGLVKLIILTVRVIADGKCRHGTVHEFAHQRHVKAGVHTAGEQDAEGYIGDHAPAYRLAQEPRKLVGGLFEAQVVTR